MGQDTRMGYETTTMGDANKGSSIFVVENVCFVTLSNSSIKRAPAIRNGLW